MNDTEVNEDGGDKPPPLASGNQRYRTGAEIKEHRTAGTAQERVLAPAARIDGGHQEQGKESRRAGVRYGPRWSGRHGISAAKGAGPYRGGDQSAAGLTHYQSFLAAKH